MVVPRSCTLRLPVQTDEFVTQTDPYTILAQGGNPFMVNIILTLIEGQ
jgi:hypothetical protein